MQRGLRFNKGSKLLWLEYTKLELAYIAKIITRRRLLGIDGVAEPKKQMEIDENMVALPIITGDEMNSKLKDEGGLLDKSPLGNLEDNPALNGAIPLAVFDAATKEIPDDVEFVYSFFNLFSTFTNLPCLTRLLDHVITYSLTNYPTSPLALFMDIKAPIIGVDIDSPALPLKIGSMLSKMTANVDKAAPRIELYQLFVSALLEILETGDDLDSTVQTVITSALNKYFKQAEKGGDIDAQMYLTWAKVLESSGKSNSAQAVITKGRGIYPNAV